MDEVLQQLRAGGHSAVAPDVAGLQPQKNEPTPGVLGLQQRYARLPGSPLTAAFTGRLLVAAPLPGAPPVEVGVTFDIVQAPATFSLPVMQKRPWDPPFQVRMTWTCPLPLQFSTTVAAFVVDEAVVTSMLTWQLPSATDAAKQLLEHSQERMIVLAPQQNSDAQLLGTDAAGSHYAEALFTFNRLQFGQPSQMRPRWLVFAGSLLGGGCVYSHFRLPTVVMSRLAEQFDKAKRVLWGEVQPVCDASVIKMDYKQLCKYIRRELAAIGISREPTEEDFRYLATRAGFVVGPDSVRATSASLGELAAFKQWFSGHIIMLKHVRQQYERTDPQVVCGFAMTREKADTALAPHPKGTFLLRFGSQGGDLVVSVRSGAAGPSTTHYSLNLTTLQHHGLEALLERNGTCEQLLDTVAGQRHLRTAILDRSYLQAVDLREARKRSRQRGGSDEGESPCPSAGGAAPSVAGLPQPMQHACASGSLYSMHTATEGATVGGDLERLPSRASIQGPHVPQDAGWPAAMEVERGGEASGMAGQRSAAQRSLLPPSASGELSVSLHPLHPFPDYSRGAGMHMPPLLLSVPPPAQPSLPGGQPASLAAGLVRFPAAASMPIPAAPTWAPAAGSLPRPPQHCGGWGSPGLSPLAQCSRSTSMPVQPAHGNSAAWGPPAAFMGAVQPDEQQQQQASAAATPQCPSQQFQHYTAAVVARSGAAAGPVAAAVTNTAAPSPPASGSQNASPTTSLPQSVQGGSAPAVGCQSVDTEPPCPLPFDRLQRQRMSSSGTDALPLTHLAAPVLAYLPPQGLQVTAGMAVPPGGGLDGETNGLKQDRASRAAELQHLLALLGNGGTAGAAGEALPSGLSGLQLGSGGNSGNGSPIVPLAGMQTGVAPQLAAAAGAAVPPQASPPALQGLLAGAQQQAASPQLRDLLGQDGWII